MFLLFSHILKKRKIQKQNYNSTKYSVVLISCNEQQLYNVCHHSSLAATLTLSVSPELMDCLFPAGVWLEARQPDTAGCTMETPRPDGKWLTLAWTGNCWNLFEVSREKLQDKSQTCVVKSFQDWKTAPKSHDCCPSLPVICTGFILMLQ